LIAHHLTLDQLRAGLSVAFDTRTSSCNNADQVSSIGMMIDW